MLFSLVKDLKKERKNTKKKRPSIYQLKFFLPPSGKKVASYVIYISCLSYRGLYLLNLERYPYSPKFSGTVRDSGFIPFLVKFPRHTTLPVKVSQSNNPIIKDLNLFMT